MSADAVPMADLNGCDPLEVMCPTCKVDAGTPCVWEGVAPVELYHAEREKRAELPDMRGDAPSTEAFEKAADASDLF